MDIGALLILLALLVITGGVVATPLIGKQIQKDRAPAARYSALLAERDRILDALQELDFDNTMGKIAEDAYAHQRASLVQRGAAVLQTLDRWHESMNGAGQLPVPSGEMDAKREEPLSEAADGLLAAGEGVPAAAADGVHPAAAVQTARATTMDHEDEIEKLITSRRQAREGKSVGFCHQCGHVIQEQDRFCANCGATHTKGT